MKEIVNAVVGSIALVVMVGIITAGCTAYSARNCVDACRPLSVSSCSWVSVKCGDK